ncbi:MAG TPA: glycosyltransferase, partial [Solirubrobacter sp.]
EGVREGAVAVAFCDADGEYAPEELPAMVAPILVGDADYVVGSRFRGDIRHMRPHRRVGNLVLTRLLRLVARTPLSDGQSGYRALSHAAARDAEIVHDFNYAQVLTLDLLGKGYRYAEVPIGYAFREHGRSFVRLGRYLRTVVPAVHRELNAPAVPPSGHGHAGALAADGAHGEHGALRGPLAQAERPAGDAGDAGRGHRDAVHQHVGLAAGEPGAADDDVRLRGAVALE